MERDQFEHARGNAKAWLESIEEMVAKLDKADSEDFSSVAIDNARDEITESVLSVQVRDGWRDPGPARPTADDTVNTAEEYEILLSTGGPALRIYGRLGQHGEPDSAELQMQDWGTPWTRYPAAEATLLSFAQCFYFGE